MAATVAGFNYPLIGQMLVNDGLISTDQLVAVLYEQKLLNLRLGETLLKKQLITHEQLDEYLAKQVELNSRSRSVEALTPVQRYHLQKLIQKAIIQGQIQLNVEDILTVIDGAISILKDEEIIKLGYLTKLHHSMENKKPDYTALPDLEKQIFGLLKIELTQPVLEEPISYGAILLGEMLIERNVINREQLQTALIEQRYTKRRLGQILIQHKLLNFDQLDQLLWEQATAQ